MRQTSFHPKSSENINDKRRTFLTVGLTAVVAFVVSRLVDTSRWWGGDKVVQKASFENFDLFETKDEIRLSERGGEPIFILDKASFRE